MSATPEDCFHLSIETVVEIHAEAIKQFGGLGGVRDENLLASAVTRTAINVRRQVPLITIWLKSPLHICFTSVTTIRFSMEINARAMMAAIVFLRINGIEPLPDSAEWEKLMLDVAASKIDRDATTRRLRKLRSRS